VLTAPRRTLFTPLQWTLLAIAFVAIGVAVPLAHAALPADHAWRPSSYAVTLAGKFMCYAMVAIAMDLIWGFTGILSLGQSRSAATRSACT
jgi:urea transport system permease protein